MYLSDVEAGGETRFTKLNISVVPKKGSAILWPSVHSDDPWKTEDHTYHEAVTVTAGEKYAAKCAAAGRMNAARPNRPVNRRVDERTSRVGSRSFWIHMFEFQKMLQNGCDNQDYYQENMLGGANGLSTLLPPKRRKAAQA